MKRRLDATDSALSRVVTQLKRYLVTMLGISGLINLLGVTLSLYVIQVFDRVLTSHSIDTLLFLSIAAVLALATTALLDGIRSFALGIAADWFARELGPDILTRSIERRLVEGQLRSELLRDLSQLRGFLSGPGVPALLDLPWQPIYLVVAFLIHPIFGLIALAGCAILFGLAFVNEKIVNKDIRAASAQAALAMRESDAIMRNAEVIDSLGMGPQMAERWSAQLGKELTLQERIGRRSAGVMTATRFTRAILQVVLYSAGALLVLGYEITGGAMMAGSIIVSRLLAPVEAMLTHWRSLLLSKEIYDRLRRFMELPRLRSTETSLPAPKGRLSVDRVSLMMPGRPTPVLRGVSFNLEAGEQLAIVGPAASGKTTLSRVILGIMRAQGGVVRLDGVDIAKWNREEFGPFVGYLPQDVELFSGTVAANIARFTGRDDSEIVRAARMAGCHELILGFPNAYDTEIGEDGLMLSGGQRQQVALARALFGRPRYIVLDEPNSNLDINGDNALRLALRRLRQAKVTTVIVTHRQAIISQVDKLLVLEDGAVKAFGPKDEILALLRRPSLPAAAAPTAQPEPARTALIEPALAAEAERQEA